MWLLFGISSIIFCILNLAWSAQKRDPKWFRFLSLSLTALTVCAFYMDGATRVVKEDWAGLMDTMPTMNTALWICVLLSILLNSVSLFKESKK